MKGYYSLPVANTLYALCKQSFIDMLCNPISYTYHSKTVHGLYIRPSM